MEAAKTSRLKLSRRLARYLRRRDWGNGLDRGGVRRRIVSSLETRWWDWGHHLMNWTGDSFGGSWDEPTMQTWWYRLGTPKHMFRTKYPRYPLSTFEIITDYDEFRQRTEGLNADQMYEWNALCFSDGSVHLGKQYWGGNFYGLERWEIPLLRRYLRRWCIHNWFGLRSWLYHQGLHAAVNPKRPFTCKMEPPTGVGSRRRCGRRRFHRDYHDNGRVCWVDENNYWLPGDLTPQVELRTWDWGTANEQSMS